MCSAFRTQDVNHRLGVLRPSRATDPDALGELSQGGHLGRTSQYLRRIPRQRLATLSLA